MAAQVGMRLVVGGVLVVAGVSKIAMPVTFARLVDAYGLLPSGWSKGVAVTLPWVEVLVGCCLVAGLWTRSAALVATSLFTVFVGAMAVTLYRGTALACGCFGAGDGEGSLWVSLVRTSVLLAVAGGLLWQPGRSPCSLDRLLQTGDGA